ncbi:MAG: isoaspartyl peptidase/L-asparaginase family protein [Burkholderiales bacterium]
MTSNASDARAVAGRKPAPGRADPASFVLVVHGGAGVIERADMSADKENAYRAGITAALMAGHEILAAGGSSIDAVAAAVSVFEDDPLFNAGRGAAFTADGTIELDAAIMDGATLHAGGCTLVTTVRNPVLLARLVMEKTRHVLLAGPGAEALARAHGLAIVDPDYFVTKQRFGALKRMQQADAANWSAPATEADKHGTVGAVALDAKGNLAAATSTGGRNNKLSGRVGDSPIIGAGTYANNATVAVSGTGEGEYFMRTLAAHSVSALVEHRGWSVQRAAEHVVHGALAALGGKGGLIALDRNGRFAMPFSTQGMYRGHVGAKGDAVVKIYQDE